MWQGVGTPKGEDTGFLDDGPRTLIQGLPRYTPLSLRERFPELNVCAVNLAEKMLQFNPYKRITGKFFSC